MTAPELDILNVLLAAKEAGATHVRIEPDGSIDIVFDKAASPIKFPERNAGGVHEVKMTLPSGRKVTYWYAYRGGPRIPEDEARRIIAAAKVVPFTR